MKNIGRTRKEGIIIGRDRFKKISAVEGLSLTFAANSEFDTDELRGLTAAERRERIIAKYTQG
jgi:fido (protein-threonine AMPylation protein)